MRFGNEVKRDTQLVIISVLILTLVTLSVSYSAFFSVQSQTTIQKITAGTLSVVIDTTSKSMTTTNMFPTPTENLPTAENPTISDTQDYATLSLTNDGTLEADFSVTLGYDELPNNKTEDDLLSFEYLNIGIFDTTNNTWVDFGNGNYYVKVTALESSGTDVYPILRDTIESGTTRQFRIYVWLSEDTPATEIGKIVYLKIDVKSVTVEGNIE